MDLHKDKPCKRIKLHMEVDDLADRHTGCLYLPDLVVEQIFSYLNLRDLGRVAQVCKQWHQLSRRSIFWRRVDTQCLSLDRWRLEKLLNFLPSCVTHLRLGTAGLCCLGMPHISVVLRDNCPRLRVLWLDGACMTYTGAWFGLGVSVSFVLDILPAELRVLVLRYSSYHLSESMIADDDPYQASKIEVLDVAHSYDAGENALIMATNMPLLRRLCLSAVLLHDFHFAPYYPVIARLRELDLERTLVGSPTFRALWEYGKHLRELYLCNTSLQDWHLPRKQKLPHLRVFCLRYTQVTWAGVQLVVDSCPSLSRLIVSIPDEFPMRAMLRVDEEIICRNDSYSPCDHFSRRDYMRDLCFSA